MQLDVGIAYSLRVDPFRIQTRVNFINALGRSNVTEWGLVSDQQGEGYILSPRLSTPFLPIISMRVST